MQQLRIQWPGEGGVEKHEIYVAAFSGHLFYDLFSQGQGGHGPLAPPGSATVQLNPEEKTNMFAIFLFIRKCTQGSGAWPCAGLSLLKV